jgi:hypothetical protein
MSKTYICERYPYLKKRRKVTGNSLAKLRYDEMLKCKIYKRNKREMEREEVK